MVQRGETARDSIKEIEENELARIETVGTEARKQISGETDRMVESARTKIDEADIETLVNEELARRGGLFRWLSRSRESRP